MISVERLDYDYNVVVQPLGAPGKTSIQLDIGVPINQELRYIPGVLETLKFAWIQYLSLLIPSLLIFWMAIGFILRYQLVETSVTSDLTQKKKF
jgi:hypothetical protein